MVKINRYYYLKDKLGNIKISPINKEYPMFWKSRTQAQNYADKHSKDFDVYEIYL